MMKATFGGDEQEDAPRSSHEDRREAGRDAKSGLIGGLNNQAARSRQSDSTVGKHLKQDPDVTKMRLEALQKYVEDYKRHKR